MSINILMPALSPTMEEGTLSRWLKSVGDRIAPGDVIAEIETDKATMEVEAVEEGTLAQILVPDGTEGVKVNEVIALLAEEGEDPEAVEAAPAQSPAQSRAPAPSPAPAPEPAQARALEASADPPPQARASQSTDAAASRAPGVDADHGALADVGDGPDRLKASPLARRLAHMKGVDLASLQGSGPHGRILRKDVEAAEASPAPRAAGEKAPAAAPAGTPEGLILPQTLDPRVYAEDSYDLKPLDGMRRTMARRLTSSFMQVPHFPLTVDLRIDRLLEARAAINSAAPEGVKVSVNDLLIKAAALALMAEPETNASYTDEGIAYHKAAHISVAVAVEGGLITPVIRDAQSKGLSAISAEMKDLAERARNRKLKPQEYMGGTFSLSNLGMFGIRDFASIINPPEGAILSVGAGELRPVVDASGALTTATVMSVTLTCDHRVIGGAEGARWLQAFKRFVEMPESMLL